MFKKFVICIVMILSLTSLGWACVGNDCEFDSNVQDTNDGGNKGYIFTYCGEKGNNSLGTWVNPKDVPELKGAKGDKGDRGATGATGSQGVAGQDGLNGVDGENGSDGQNGEQGETGSTGETGAEGKEGSKGDVGLTGQQGKGLEDRQEGILEIRVLDTKNTTWSIYNGYDFNNQINITGVKVTIKFGTSYEEREITKLQQRIEALEDR